MSAMSESAEVELCQNASNSDLVENQVIIEANGDPNGVPLIRPDVDNCIESKTIECGDNSESERNSATTVKTRVTQLNGMDVVNGMRTTDTDATHTPDVCSDSRHIDDGVDGMREEPSQDSQTIESTSASILNSDNEVIIVETVVKSESNEVTLITDTTIKTTINSNHNSNENSSGSSSDSKSEKIHNNIDKNNESNKVNNNTNDKNCDAMTTTTTSRPKQLKGLLKKPKDKSIKTNGEKRRVTFSETMQVFCDDWPQNLMPQIIALKSPTDFNLVEVQGYMFEPPVEYQDFLPFDPPPDYRDFIANSLCAFDRDLSINYIDDEEEEDSLLRANKSDQNFLNEFSSKWESMILNNNESLEEEQIIGVLKEDAILQAIGSHISLPEENLCPEDFPIHFQNKIDSNIKLAESELSDITSDDGNDSSPTGSLQDIQSDSSITSQDTIILINTDSNDNSDNMELFSNKSIFKELNTKNSEDINNSLNSECVVNCETNSEDKTDLSNNSFQRAINSEITQHLNCEETNDSVGRTDDVFSSPDVTHNVDQNGVRSETHESDLNNERKPSEAELNSEQKQNVILFTNEESNELRTNHSNSFRRNLQFYENMFANNSTQSDDNTKEEKPMKQSHRVSHFFIQNNPKFPIITQTIGTNVNENNKQMSESSLEVKQMSNEVPDTTPSNLDNCPPIGTTRVPPQQTSQTQPNANNWSADEFIIEYTSEPKALVPSKRTASLSNFATAQMTINPHILRNNPNVNNIQYLSLNRNGETPKQWNAYNMDSHNNSSQMHYPNPNPPIQRSLSPNPPMVSAPNRPVSPQPTAAYYQNRPQYTPHYPPTHTMPVHVMYNRMSAPQPVQQRVSLRLPVMSQTLGRPHNKPPPYHYHIQQHTNDFPNPSEIRRRDGLNAYPHVMNQTPAPGALPVPPIHHNNNHNNINQNIAQNGLPQNMTKDELEQFVQQDIQRTERIKKRYSMTEEDDPSFGFARRPSVRGIRPKFESTNEILKQMQTPNANCAQISSQMAGSHMSWPHNSYSNSNNNLSNNQTIQHNQTLPKKPHIVQIRFQPQNPMSVKYANESPDSTQSQPSHPKQTTGPQMSRTLPRPSSLLSQSQMNAIRSEDGFVIRLPANVSRDQLKQQIQRQIEQQFQSKLKQKNSSSMPSNTKPMMSSNDERGAPEGASSSPKHSSDLLFAKNLSSNSGNKSSETTANKQQTNDTNKKLVINPENNTNSETNDSQGVIYYAMNV